MLSACFVLAATGTLLAPPILYPVTHNDTLTIDMFLFGCSVVGPLWVVSAVVTLRRHGKRGLWVLLGLPFALCCPGLMFLLLLACSTRHACL